MTELRHRAAETNWCQHFLRSQLNRNRDSHHSAPRTIDLVGAFDRPISSDLVRLRDWRENPFARAEAFVCDGGRG
jgi:hypothetical protein